MPPSRCSHSDSTVSLPVVDAPRIKKSRASRWRAGVLIGIHLLIAIHVAHWLATGSTMTPLEPSEGMEFGKSSVVNAGLIFFLLMIASTVVLGRWFCGWACHLVALQDLARWLLGRIGLRPKPARLGLLGLVPLAAFVYMFLGPLAYRLVVGNPIGTPDYELTRPEFWSTFPPWVPAILTLITCGFVSVYLLGSKGFCTYGCPYGAIFGMADQLAPARIVVNDDCEHCGHCTAVCSSNVRVHEEVRDYGMVVDPGCMKCLDCVSVCPNHALSYGFKRPSLFAPRRTPQDEADGSVGPWLTNVSIATVFLFAQMCLFISFDDDFTWWYAILLTAVTAPLAMLFAGRPTGPDDTPLGEQIAVAVLFLAAVFAFRGLYHTVPFLFALGLAAAIAYLLLIGSRLITRPHAHLHRRRLKVGGSLRPAGLAYAAMCVGLIAVSIYATALQRHSWGLRRALATLDSGEGDNDVLETARRHARGLDRIDIVSTAWSDVPLTRLTRYGGDRATYERRMDELATRLESPVLAIELGDHYRSVGDVERAEQSYRRATTWNEHDPTGWTRLGGLLLAAQRPDEASRAFTGAIDTGRPAPQALYSLGVMDMVAGRFDPAITRFRAALAIAPDYAAARENLAGALCASGRFEDGAAEYRRALELNPNDSETHELLARAYLEMEDYDQAAVHLERAVEIAPRRDLFLGLAALAEQRGDPAAAAAWRQRAGDDS